MNSCMKFAHNFFLYKIWKWLSYTTTERNKYTHFTEIKKQLAKEARKPLLRSAYSKSLVYLCELYFFFSILRFSLSHNVWLRTQKRERIVVNDCLLSNAASSGFDLQLTSTSTSESRPSSNPRLVADPPTFLPQKTGFDRWAWAKLRTKWIQTCDGCRRRKSIL